MEVAFHFPRVEIVGIDISQQVIEYAHAQARSRALENVHFQLMNVMEPLAFPDASFAPINGRGLSGCMLPATWPRFLQECFRLLIPGGVIRLTEHNAAFFPADENGYPNRGPGCQGPHGYASNRAQLVQGASAWLQHQLPAAAR
ncbi:hypothetical protein A4R35_00515 [Thermogemmatispora tikiterensis]|uniref:Methyltransferase domain-containing protein n=2 Tax=Thermogemmatispora tikiterensis TaxID=1825093 RepID=A0A328VEM1_9CHLR|nr:hypothetical protein A4R35_00515 [Thermogemmatispora tikiterensis]